MKLIVTGSTGFAGKEIIRQAIHNPSITSIVALARRETEIPQDAGDNALKLKSVVCGDFSNYSEDVKKELAGADACIWYIITTSLLPAIIWLINCLKFHRTLAVTPAKSSAFSSEEIRTINFDYIVTGIETISPLASNPFRFINITGFGSVRDQNKKPWLIGDYLLMRVSASFLSLLFICSRSLYHVSQC